MIIVGICGGSGSGKKKGAAKIVALALVCALAA